MGTGIYEMGMDLSGDKSIPIRYRVLSMGGIQLDRWSSAYITTRKTDTPRQTFLFSLNGTSFSG